MFGVFFPHGMTHGGHQGCSFAWLRLKRVRALQAFSRGTPRVHLESFNDGFNFGGDGGAVTIRSATFCGPKYLSANDIVFATASLLLELMFGFSLARVRQTVSCPGLAHVNAIRYVYRAWR